MWKLLFLLVLFCSTSALAEMALPDPAMTPGAVDSSATWSIICNGTTRARRYVSSATRTAVFAAYNIPPGDRFLYELDHDIPLSIGGSNAPSNLWPQPLDEAMVKDRLEVELQVLVCLGKLPLDQAQREIADDWVAAARRYLKPSDVSQR